MWLEEDVLTDGLTVSEREPAVAETRGSTMGARLPSWVSWLIPSMAWAAISAFYYGRFLAHPTAGVPGGADGVLYVWFFKSVEHSIANLSNPLLSHGMNAPIGLNMMWNAPVLLLAVLLAPLTAAIGPVPTVGLAMAASPALSATTAYYVLRRITGRVAGSIVAATFYGFSPFFAIQYGHLHLIANGPLLPLILLLGYRLFVWQDGSPVRAGIWLGLTVAALFLISEEVAAMVAVAAVLAVLFLAVLHPKQVPARLRYAAIGTGVAVGVAALIVGYPLWYQQYGSLALRNTAGFLYSSDLASFVRPSAAMFFKTSADVAANGTFYSGGTENTGYLGVPVLVVIAACLIWLAVKRSILSAWWLLAAGTVASFSLGATIWVNGHRTDANGPWWLFHRLGPLKSVVASRFSLLTALLVAFLIAATLARISGRAYAAVTAAVAVALVSLVPAGQHDGILPIHTPRFFTTSAVKRIPAGSTVLVLPQRDSAGTAPRVMFWQVKAGMRFNIIGGYGVFSNDGHWSYLSYIPAFARILNDAGDTGAQPTTREMSTAYQSLTDSPVSYIVISPLVRHPDVAADVAEQIAGCSAERVADVLLCQVPHS